MLIFLLLNLALQARAETPHIKLEQLTGQSRATTGVDFGDPSRPEFTASGASVMTTGGWELKWPTEKDFFAGHEPQVIALKICHADGTPIDRAKEAIWDPSLREGTLYGSLMIPPPEAKNAEWPRDVVTRRTFAFHWKNNCWTRNAKPLVESNIHSWLGHSYGHEFIDDESGQTWMFYEKVSSDKNGLPWITEICARKMKDADTTDAAETTIFKVEEGKYPATHRSFGGELAEGPRPFRANGLYFVSFSSGDYNSDHYGINLLWSKSINGPYTPYLNDAKTDLKDFGLEVQKVRPMTWGAGRGNFFERKGEWWVIFHGIPKPALAQNRSLFLAPIKMTPAEPPNVREPAGAKAASLQAQPPQIKIEVIERPE